jgi:hypothetical protein
MTTPVYGSSSNEPPHNRAGAVGIPARAPGRKAVGILLAPATGRGAAFSIIGVPLAAFLVIGFLGGGSSSGDGGGQSPYSGQVTQSQAAYPGYSPAYDTSTADSGSGLTATTDSAPDYGSSATDTATDTTTASASPSTTGTTTASPSPSATGPAAVVLAAYADINKHDYQDAYNLGLAQNGESLQTFTDGYSTTQSDTVTVTGVSGGIVGVTLLAVSTDGSQHTYSGTYTVSGGIITGADLQQVN